VNRTRQLNDQSKAASLEIQEGISRTGQRSDLFIYSRWEPWSATIIVTYTSSPESSRTFNEQIIPMIRMHVDLSRWYVPCAVVGVMTRKGESSAEQDPDDVILLPISTAHLTSSQSRQVGRFPMDRGRSCLPCSLRRLLVSAWLSSGKTNCRSRSDRGSQIRQNSCSNSSHYFEEFCELMHSEQFRPSFGLRSPDSYKEGEDK